MCAEYRIDISTAEHQNTKLGNETCDRFGTQYIVKHQECK